MAAINPIVVREAASHLMKRKNWAAREPGVVLVFAIVFVVACALLSVAISRSCKARKERKLATKPQ